MRCGSRASLEGDNSKLVLDRVFNGEPVQGLESRVGMISGAVANDNFGESILSMTTLARAF